VIRALPVVVGPDTAEPPSGMGADHPMRRVTRAIAFEPNGWTAERRAEVVSLFDSLAGEWHTKGGPGREAPLRDALDRGLDEARRARDALAAAGGAGGPDPAFADDGGALAVDIGAGTGLYTAVLAERFTTVVSVDISGEMLRNASAAPALRVQADASVLPVADGAVDVLVLANAFLFAGEVERVLAPSGVVVWVNSRGSDTPIHLTADEVDGALFGDWDGVASRAGWGTWSVHWRRPRT
jgi:SAM-dependent methyltransferase